MSFTKLSPQPANLTTGEIGLELDDTTLVAVSVIKERPANNSGLVLKVTARCIDADGTTQTCACGDPIQTSFNHSSDANEIATVTEAVITKDLFYAALGEPLTALSLSDGVLATASIRNAVIIASASAPADPTTVLGL